MDFFKLLCNSARAAKGFTKTKNDLNNAAPELRQLFSSDTITPDTFLDLYNMRSYNFASKRNDIKFMKSVDFEGAYIIHNHSKDRYYIGVAEKVFRKLERIFTGYERKDIYMSWKNGRKTTIRVVRLENSGFDNLDRLYNHLCEQYYINDED